MNSLKIVKFSQSGSNILRFYIYDEVNQEYSPTMDYNRENVKRAYKILDGYMRLTSKGIDVRDAGLISSVAGVNWKELHKFNIYRLAMEKFLENKRINKELLDGLNPNDCYP